MTRRFKTFLLSLFTLLPVAAPAVEITGAGSSAAAPLYTRWAASYRLHSGVALAYQAIGSSAGLRQIKARTVSFGASDVAMPRDQARKEKLVCFPSAISGVVPVVNIPGIKSGDLQLSGEVLANIFAGKITSWNDDAIARLNPERRLPKLAITVVVRQDGSGTTYNFTDYLGKVSAEWKNRFGTDFTIAWPAGTSPVKGSGGVSAAVSRIAGAIGYIDYNYVLQDQLTYAKLRNRNGRFVTPSAFSFAAALNNSTWKNKANFEEMLTDKPGNDSWPIAMGTFVLVPRATDHPEATIAALKFFTWAFMKGDNIVSGVDFVRLPDQVQARIYRELTTITDRNGKPLEWSLM